MSASSSFNSSIEAMLQREKRSVWNVMCTNVCNLLYVSVCVLFVCECVCGREDCGQLPKVGQEPKGLGKGFFHSLHRGGGMLLIQIWRDIHLSIFQVHRCIVLW